MTAGPSLALRLAFAVALGFEAAERFGFATGFLRVGAGFALGLGFGLAAIVSCPAAGVAAGAGGGGGGPFFAGAAFLFEFPCAIACGEAWSASARIVTAVNPNVTSFALI